MTQCFVCCDWKKTILIRSAEGKKNVLGILHMLRIHTGLRKWSKRNVLDLYLKKKNPFDIGVTWINIAKSELLFEQYRMDLNREKYNIEVWNDDAIKCNRVFFDFIQQMFNNLDGFYLHKRCLMIYTIIQYQLRKQIAA